MRSVQVIDQSSEQTTRAEHVVGIDESGNINGSDTFVLVALRCPRERGERLAELLIDNDLAPWLGKSQTLAAKTTQDERVQRVEGLLDGLDEASIPWRAAVGQGHHSIHHKSAAVCVLSKQTITQATDYQGDALLIPDGNVNMYGNSQQHLRTQAAQLFDGSFQSTFGGVYVTGLPKADLTYPEVTAADYIAGYLREAVDERGEQVQTLPEQVVRFDQNWREPDVSRSPFYRIQGLSGEYDTPERTRAIAWITGRHPNGADYDVSSQWENKVQYLESETVQQYLLNTLSP
jgi:hypothetical protein